MSISTDLAGLLVVDQPGEADLSVGRVCWLVINLDRSPERLVAFERRLEPLGISVTRIPAIDGRTHSFSLPGIDKDLYRRAWGRDLQPDEAGCFLSHVRALDHFVSSRSQFAMILEDDAVVTSDAVRLVETLTAHGAPDDWDLVKFESHGDVFGLPIRNLSIRHRLCAFPTRTRGAASYLVNRAGAEAMLIRLLPMRAPFDHAFENGWATGIRVRGILPWPATTMNGPSTIARADHAPRYKLSVMWRTATKITLMFSAVLAWSCSVNPLRTCRWLE